MFKNYGDVNAVIDEKGNHYTYASVFADSDSFYRQIGRRCLIFILCRNVKEALTGYISCLDHRIVPLMISAELDTDLYEHLINTYHPAYVWSPVDCHLTKSMTSIWELDSYRLYRTGLEEYRLYDELALLMTTSGSTGSPKLVRQSYENIKANTESIIEYLGLVSSERAVTSLQMNYTYGLSVINTHLYVGASLLMTNSSLMQKEFWELMKEHHATSIAGVPYTYEMLDRLHFRDMELPFLRTMTQAGGKLSLTLHKEFADYARKAHKKFVVMYGQTEATARMSYLPGERTLEKCGSIGIAIPGGRFELVDENGNVISTADKVGELVYYGRNVTLGYAQKGEELALGDVRHGRLITGDMAKRDEEGFYYIVGRKKRFLKIFGNRISLDETEQLLKERFGVHDLEIACGGIDDKMYIFISGDAFDFDKMEHDIKGYLAEKTGLNTYAFCVLYVDAIPKNDAGKILYDILEQYYDKR